MDAMMIVGGDIFGDHTDYGGLLVSVETIKSQGGQVFLLGLSLLESYSPEINYRLKLLFTWADVIVVRESETYRQIQGIAPKANVIAATDMAFATDITDIINEKQENGILGISVRKKIPRNAPDAYAPYCESIANTVEHYLKMDTENQVRFLALSKGVFDDEEVAHEITALCSEKYRERIQCVSFEGDVDGYIREMQRCEKLLCTRFHALVFAIMLKKPFVPIAYEEKTKRLLKEIGYYGICPSYEEQWNPVELLNGFEDVLCSESILTRYLDKAKSFFLSIDPFFKNGKRKTKINYLCKKVLITAYRIMHKLKKIDFLWENVDK